MVKCIENLLKRGIDMKDILTQTKAFIKRKLGLCNSKGCYKKAIVEIKISA